MSGPCLTGYTQVYFKFSWPTFIYILTDAVWETISTNKYVSQHSCLQTLNDWYDRDIDAINEPYRPIPSGAISENEVCLFEKVGYLFGICDYMHAQFHQLLTVDI